MLGLRIAFIISILLFGNSSYAEGEVDLEILVSRSMPAIVSIRAETPDGVMSGSGFVIDSSGVVVTNLHVIEGATRLAIKLHSGEVHDRIRVASYDAGRDLAILRIPGFDLPALSLGNSSEVAAGESVFAIGSPSGLEESVTRGIVSSVRIRDDGTKVIQTDSAASPGSSGGPLLDSQGDVIGVVTYKIAGGESLNFAIPINYVQALLAFEELISLSELNQNLTSSVEGLFVSREGGSLSGAWLSLTSGTERQLRQEGEYVYGTIKTEYINGTYDMKLQEDGTYRGIIRGQFYSWYFSSWDGSRVDVNCAYEEEIELLSHNAKRIEGQILTIPYPEKASRQKKYLKSCGKSELRYQKWEEFTWVRND